MLKDKKILMVIAPKDFRDAEYNEPRKVFDNSGMAVKVASIQGGHSIGAEGTAVRIDLTISDVKIDDFDAVAFIGGPGMAQIIDDDSLQMLAKRFYLTGKLTTAICVAPAILAKAGILEGKKVTSWSGVKDELIKAGASYVDQAVVVDNNIITADGPKGAYKFGEEIVKKLLLE
jgi:protease I